MTRPAKVLPCPFTGPMVRALHCLERPKTQTRRLRDAWEVGDRLWVREAWRVRAIYDELPPRELPAEPPLPVLYEADGPDAWPAWAREPTAVGRLRPPMFLPRWASRTMLEVVDKRHERLQDISEADAIAEGIEVLEHSREWRNYLNPIECCFTARASYASLWDDINGHKPGLAWEDNPMVWAYTFKDVTP